MFISRGGDDKCVQNFSLNSTSKIDYFKNTSMVGWVTLICFLTGDVLQQHPRVVDCERVLTLSFSHKAENFLTPRKTNGFLRGRCSIGKKVKVNVKINL